MRSLYTSRLFWVAAALTVALVMAFTGHYVPPEGALGLAPMLLGDTAATEFKKLEDALVKKSGEVIEAVQKALRDEVSKWETVTGKTNEKLTEVASEAKAAVDAMAEFKARMTDIEQKLAKRPSGDGADESKTAGQIFVESDVFKKAVKDGAKFTDKVEVGASHQRKTAIINATGQNQPLVPDMRVPGIIANPNRRLTIRDLLPQLRTNSNLVQFPKENVFTNSAAIQISSPNDKENVVKAESGITFTLSNAPVETIAHFIPASRQILDDAPGLAGYIDSRLMYGLKLVEETEILTGDGTNGHLSGLNANATAYSQSVSNDTKIDCLLKSILQCALSEYAADGIVLHPTDWYGIRLLKDTQGRYLFGNPQDSAEPRMWGLPVVSTNSQTAGTFLTASFGLAAAIWDRMDATVELSREHSDFFTRNMVAILCEERMCVTVYRASALIKGSLPALGT